MKTLQHKYVFNDEKMGVVEGTLFNSDLELKEGDYIQIQGPLGERYYRIVSEKKILDFDKNVMIHILNLSLEDNPYPDIL